MNYGNTYPKGVKPVSTAKAAGSNIVDSRLNKGGDRNWRGKRGKCSAKKRGKMAY